MLSPFSSGLNTFQSKIVAHVSFVTDNDRDISLFTVMPVEASPMSATRRIDCVETEAHDVPDVFLSKHSFPDTESVTTILAYPSPEMGVSLLTEYTLSDGKLTEKKIASCSENNDTYTWDGNDVSKDDFWTKHQSYINNYTTPDYTEYTSREDFATTIESY